MKPIAILTAFGLCLAEHLVAQTVTNSQFTGAGDGADYSDVNNWNPPQVPDNNANTSYDVTINASFLAVDVDATISSLTLAGNTDLDSTDHSLTVTGATDITGLSQLGGISLEAGTVDTIFNLGTLTSFAQNTLTDRRHLPDYWWPGHHGQQSAARNSSI